MSFVATYEARGEDGGYVGEIVVSLDDDGAAPRVVRDVHGSTWVFTPGFTVPSWYQRVRCADAWLRVTL